MKDWQFFTLLSAIYAAPFLSQIYSKSMSLVFMVFALFYYFAA